MTAESMAPAPSLPAILNEVWTPATAPGEPAPDRVDAAPQAAIAVRADASTEVLARYQEHMAQLSQGLADFMLTQQALHERFLSMRRVAYDSLLHAASFNGSTVNGSAVAVVAADPGRAPTATPAARPAESPAEGADGSDGHPRPVGLTFSREQLEIHAGGRISDIFGPQFAAQDHYHRQVRLPQPPLLLADRVTGLQAEPAKLGNGTIWTETDVSQDSWYLHDGYMPPGVLVETGQTILALLSYMGVDLDNRGERVYRLLGGELIFRGDLPMAGDTLHCYTQLDSHATQGDARLMFFHSECRNGDRPQLSIRNGQAGLFTDAELAGSIGCLWSPEGEDIVADPRLDPPAVATTHTRLDREQLEAFAAGDTFGCFGPGFERAKTHTRSPHTLGDRMLLIDRVTHLEQNGGPWGRGYLRAELDVSPDLWFFAGHLPNDPCMPGTLMFEGCLQGLAVFLAGRGYSIDRDGWRFQPVPEIPYRIECRGQVTPGAQRLVTEVFIEEVTAGPKPTAYAAVLCTVDGRKAFHARRIALELVPDWPLRVMPELVADAVSDPRPCAEVDGFRFDQASLLACALGKPTDMFGPIYRRFDGPGRVPRLPAPPFLFMSRINEVQGPIGVMKPGAKISVDYDIPPDAWYLDENGNRAMPFAVLLEAALQPCGWISYYVGSALSVDREIGIRNLDGTGTLHCEVLPDNGTLTTHVELLEVSANGPLIIQTFQVRCLLGDIPVYDLRTVFGYFPPETLAVQAGLPTTDGHSELLNRDSDYLVDLTARPHEYFSPTRPALAQPKLLMIDRIDGFWPGTGEAGLGQIRAVKDIDPGEWFFKAHFFQDPVQPGSLGITAMIQALQFYMLEAHMDDGVENPRFESLATQHEMSWKYRGQVLPHHARVHTTIDVTQAGRDERGPYAVCTASLWADGQRIYEAVGLGMRIVSGGAAGQPTGIDVCFDIARDPWLLDHSPTFVVPALSMMNMVDLLARGSTGTGPVVAVRDLRVTGWFLVDRPRRLRSECDNGTVRLLDDDGQIAAKARIVHGRYPERPTALAPFDGPDAPLPYDAGLTFHGPAFQLLEKLVQGRGAASSLLRAQGGVPVGMLNPGLLDAALHGIPHVDLDTWGDAYSADKVAYPAFIPLMEFFGPTPTIGAVRCEVRERPFLGTPDYPVFAVQLIGEDGVWCQFELVESCFPKGPLVAAEPIGRRAFIRDRLPVDGLRLSRTSGPERATLLSDAEVQDSDWLPGTIEAVYGTRATAEIARREHVAAAHHLHPGRVFQQLPLTRFDLRVTESDGQTRVDGDGLGALDIAEVCEFWADWFGREEWPVEDIHCALIERFLGRVVLDAPEEYAQMRGRSVLYLANHQTGVESLIFSVVASALNRVPTVTLAKIEHRETWLGRLIRHCFAYPGAADPKLMTFFDRDDKESLVRIIAELAEEMTGPGRSVMVHIEGTRSLSCRNPIQKMSGAFTDMALAVGAPIVPVRFIGGLPAEPIEKRLEFPLGMGRQDIHFGRPILPEELAPLHYGARKKLAIDAINALGVPNEQEQPLPADPAFAQRVLAWQQETGVSAEHATLREALAELPSTSEPIRRLLHATNAAEPADADAQGRWLAELGRRLLG
jgi:3-hydroxymyristoyl/3-hydroxydecanoyl-(acyl carrier protein) dehydratase/1-acyl-sn-glycerol-3-phosphate acyltransferase